MGQSRHGSAKTTHADLLRQWEMSFEVMTASCQTYRWQIIPFMCQPFCLIHHGKDDRFQADAPDLGAGKKMRLNSPKFAKAMKSFYELRVGQNT